MADPVFLKSHFDVSERHATILARALAYLEAHSPVSEQTLQDPDEQMLLHLDQFNIRFAKLQDQLGAKVFPAILSHLGEDSASMPFIDRLSRLESLGLLDSADQWLMFRSVRNRLAHDYPEAPAIRHSDLEIALEAAHNLLATYQRLKQKLHAKPRFADLIP